jgi:protein-S-isoprenylcysteine O-methyltransferase Ste14
MASFDATAPVRTSPRSGGSHRLLTPLLGRRAGSILSRGILVALFAVFAWANFSHWRSTGAPSGLGTTLLEGWAAVLFLVRRVPDQLSLRPLAWLAAPIGSFAMLLARPTDGGFLNLPCELVQLAGLLIALASLGTLGRSFGIVAANRGVKTRGPYRLVRHPAYLGYFISYLGYVAENPSVVNVTLLCVSTAFQLVRINEEEQLLSDDSSYQSYRASVRFRLIPRLY